MCFDKLSHIRTILMADAYFRSASATAAARIQALERQASLMAREQRHTFHGLIGSSPAMRLLYDPSFLSSTLSRDFAVRNVDR
jgi:hypothetical protein